jgi:hypothetical protein
VSEQKTFVPVKIGQIIPIAGFNWKVIDCNKSDMVLRVDSVSKSGRKMGYIVNMTRDDPLMLKPDTFEEV